MLRELGGGFARHHRGTTIRTASYVVTKPPILVDRIQIIKKLRGHRNAVYCGMYVAKISSTNSLYSSQLPTSSLCSSVSDLNLPRLTFMVKCDNPQMLSLDALSMSCMLDYSGEVVLEQIFRCWGSYVWNNELQFCWTFTFSYSFYVVFLLCSNLWQHWAICDHGLRWSACKDLVDRNWSLFAELSWSWGVSLFLTLLYGAKVLWLSKNIWYFSLVLIWSCLEAYIVVGAIIYQFHLWVFQGDITDMAVSSRNSLVASASNDHSIRVVSLIVFPIFVSFDILSLCKQEWIWLLIFIILAYIGLCLSSVEFVKFVYLHYYHINHCAEFGGIVILSVVTYCYV